jgi:hypothetical protein
MQKSQSLFYLTTALHVSGVTIIHLQEHKTTASTASGNVNVFPYEQLFIQTFHHNGNIITEQGTVE